MDINSKVNWPRLAGLDTRLWPAGQRNGKQKGNLSNLQTFPGFELWHRHWLWHWLWLALVDWCLANRVHSMHTRHWFNCCDVMYVIHVG